MRKTYKIEHSQFVHNNLHLSLNDIDEEKQFQPAGQVLADSDNKSFIYLLEDGEQYSYLSLPNTLWKDLVELLKTEQDPYLQIGNQTIELQGFNEELRALVYNIEGNDNYGNDFVLLVEEIFKSILKTDIE